MPKKLQRLNKPIFGRIQCVFLVLRIIIVFSGWIFRVTWHICGNNYYFFLYTDYILNKEPFGVVKYPVIPSSLLSFLSCF